MPFKTIKIHGSITLSEVIKGEGWGANKLIYYGGVRITDKLKLWLDWDVIIDPNHIIDKTCFVGSGKGKNIVKILVYREAFEIKEEYATL